MPANPVGAPWTAAIIVALAATMSGGVLAAAAAVLGLPDAINDIGLLLFLLGVLIVAVFGMTYSQVTGRSVLGSIWFGVKVGLHWLWYFMP